MRGRRTFVALLAAGSLVVAACGEDSDDADAPAAEGQDSTSTSAAGDDSTTTTEAMDEVSETAGADLRVALNLLLTEHVVLASDATGAALGGRTAEYEAAVEALGGNSQRIADAIGSIYGDEAGEAFLPLWEKHIGFVVAYTEAVAADDTAAADTAVADLTAYASEFAEFLNAASPELPVDAATDLVTEHILTLKTVIDAQKSGDPVAAYTALREAMAHMAMIADPLAATIAAQFPEQFADDPMTDAVGLRVALNNLLAEHAVLASDATGAALGGRTDEFEAAAGALGANSDDVSAAIGSVYGAEAGEAFAPLWAKHIDFVVAYTQAIAADDTAAAETAVEDLLAYAGEFAAFLNAASPELPVDAVTDLVTEHITTLKAVIDAQKAGDPAGVYEVLGAAVSHMQMVADPLAATIVAQFPDQF